jgi:hypothetical protein
MGVFLFFICYTDDGIMKTEKRCFNNNKIKGNAELMLVILNCTLLYNQKDGWTPP